MKVVCGDLWGELGIADLILVTTNSYVDGSGHLVMGRGAAAEAAARFPELARHLGHTLGRWGMVDPAYGVLIARLPGLPSDLGAFQVKNHFRDAAHKSLIAYSVGKLNGIAGEFDRIAMNFPGIGWGKLTEEDVLPLLVSLPDNVRIYKHPEEPGAL